MLYKKFIFPMVLGTLGTFMLVMYLTHGVGNRDIDGPSTVIVRNHQGGGFFANLSIINHCLHEHGQSQKKVIVLLDSGLYKEDRPQFIADNPYYNKYDWFSYYFEPINQTDKPLRYWKKCVDRHPLARAINSGGDAPQIFTVHSIKDYYAFDSEAFHRIWHKYFKLRPHIQQMIDEFKHKHDFANKYVITFHYRGTDKYNTLHAYEDNHEHPPYEFCSALIQKKIKESGEPLSNIITFIATDEQPFADYMRQESVNAVFIDAIRSNASTSDLDFSTAEKVHNTLSAQSVHLGMPDKSNYIKGRDVLVDAILLGSGNIFIKSRGNVSRQAAWIGGPHMKSIDLVNEFNAYKKKSKSGDDWKTIYDDL